MIAPVIRPLFDLGRVTITPAALHAINESGQDVAAFLDRHVHGDWGSIMTEDSDANRAAILTGQRIKSVYRTDNGTKILIATEAVDHSGDRPLTTIYLPSED